MSQRRSANASGGPTNPRLERPYADSAPRTERSDLVDVKAMAAAARVDSGRVVAPNPSDISGVVARRDSVVGARVTPPPRAQSAELPGWFWGALGCLSVLAVGFSVLWWLGRSGDLLAAGGAAAIAASPAPRGESPGGTPPAAGIQVEPMAAAAPVPGAPAPPPPAEPKRPVAHERSPAGATAGGGHGAHAAAAQPAGAPAAEEEADDPPEEPKAPAASEAPAPRQPPVREVAALRALGVGEPSDEERAKEPSPREVVDAALTALAPKVRRCFIKFQIPGRAQVRLVATPAGAAESVAVVGDFEDTPTGDCIATEVGGATLPAFSGTPLKISHTYQLR